MVEYSEWRKENPDWDKDWMAGVAAQLEMIISLGARESTLASHLLHAHTASVGKELTRTQLKVADEMFNASPEAEIRYTRQMDKIWEISKKRTADFEKEVKLDVDIPGMAGRKIVQL